MWPSTTAAVRNARGTGSAVSSTNAPREPSAGLMGARLTSEMSWVAEQVAPVPGRGILIDPPGQVEPPVVDERAGTFPPGRQHGRGGGERAHAALRIDGAPEDGPGKALRLVRGAVSAAEYVEPARGGRGA